MSELQIIITLIVVVSVLCLFLELFSRARDNKLMVNTLRKELGELRIVERQDWPIKYMPVSVPNIRRDVDLILKDMGYEVKEIEAKTELLKLEVSDD